MEKVPDLKISSGYIFVNNAPALAEMTRALKSTPRAAIDTEADSLHHYSGKVCLIQMSFLGNNYIIDPFAGFGLEEFLEVLSGKELIFQGADYDLRMMKKSFGFRPNAPIFDTMVAAQMLGYEKIGLAALVEKFFGVVLSKSGQKADWAQRPLPERLLTYASDDTKYLEAIADIMSAELNRLGRMAWHRECCERVVKSSGLPEKNEDKEAWRVKGSSKMSSQELVYVFELWKWRDEEARRKDRPAFYILQNEDLVALAAWRAQNPQAPLQQGPEFLKRFKGEKLTQLENAVRAADSTPREKWPLPQKRAEWTDERPDPEKLDALTAACKKIAEGLKVEASFVASRAALTSVIMNKPRSLEKVMEVSGLMKWQAELLMPAIQTALGKN